MYDGSDYSNEWIVPGSPPPKALRDFCPLSNGNEPKYCAECGCLEQILADSDTLRATCKETGEKLNPYELHYSTGIGKRCPYYKNQKGGST